VAAAQASATTVEVEAVVAVVLFVLAEPAAQLVDRSQLAVAPMYLLDQGT